MTSVIGILLSAYYLTANGPFMINLDKSTLILKILGGAYLGIYALLLIGELAMPFDTDSSEYKLIEFATIMFAFTLYVIGYIWAFFNEKWGGIILLVWHLTVWAFALLLWVDAGMVLLFVFPAFFLGVLLLRNGFIRQNGRFMTEPRTWDLSLKILLINYTIIYMGFVAYQLLGPERIDLGRAPGPALILALVIYIAAFILSWRHMFSSGLILIIWYLIVYFLRSNYPEFADSGPVSLFGVVILIQGVFYIVHTFKFGGLGRRF